jgi:hypothetical protein
MVRKRRGARIEGVDLDKDKKEREHEREQGLLDLVFLLGRLFLVGFPVVVILWFAAQLGHYAWAGNWDAFDDRGRSAFALLAPYFLGVFTRFGFIEKK